MDKDWQEILIAYLHDPPDKALSIRGHEPRACRYLSAALQREVTPSELKGTEDAHASAAERLPLPTAGRNGEWAVGPENRRLTVFHPLSGTPQEIDVAELDETMVEETIRDIANPHVGGPGCYYALWRLLPDRLAERRPSFRRLPADTRVPDHTIWHHMCITAGLKAAYSGGQGAAMLSFSLGPVQPFIEAARTVRDLWSGSMILAWLSFQAMLPVIERYGPTAIVYPWLHGLPLLDLWLTKKNVEVPGLTEAARKAPCLPNRFFAVVPWENAPQGQSIADLCEKQVRDKWRELAGKVRDGLDARLREKGIACDDWAKRWDDQIEDYFEIRTSVLPLRECGDEALARLAGYTNFAEAFPNLAKVRGLADAIPGADRPGYSQDNAGRWQEQVDLSARLMQVRRSVRPVPRPCTDEKVPAKCSLFGSLEQMGPDEFSESREFWDAAAQAVRWHGVRLRRGESLCAVALAKRFAGPALLADELGLNADSLRFPDTATVAAAEWLAKANENDFGLDPDRIRRQHDEWSGQWLHWATQQADKDESPVPDEVWRAIRKAKKDLGPPPAYYAVLVMDGDQMGAWLAGEKSPSVGEILHPKLRKYFEHKPDTAAGLAARRPLGPARHAAMSEALANFALYVVPRVVEKHHGTLIYAGGDDVLALLPRRTAVACAGELRRAFRGETQGNGGVPKGYDRHQGRDLLMMGPTATLSAGIAVVHYKEDLRAALQAARDAEKTAKNSGRDLLAIAALRRSGERSLVLCPWDMTEDVGHLVDAFGDGASDRWAYHLRREAETLEALPVEAMQAEIQRQVGRADLNTRTRLDRSNGKSAAKKLCELFDRYLKLTERCWKADANASEKVPHCKAFEQFIQLCQTASFLARGEERR